MKTFPFAAILLLWFAASAAPGEEPEISILSPSPDGKLAFRKTWTPGQGTVELIEKESGKVLLRAAENDVEQGESRLDTEQLWAPDSSKVALMVSTMRRGADVVVLGRDAAGVWKVLKMPALPSAAIPEKYAGDPRVHHCAVADWSKPVRWKKDGKLVVETETTLDGNNNEVTAKRTTVLSFGPNGSITVTSSTQKVTARFEDPPEER